MSKNVSVFSSKDDLLDQTLKLVLDAAQASIQARDRFTIALAGGSTPKPLYEKLAQTNQDWEKWHIFWGDERFVPADHPDSNERMAREAWLNHVPIPPENIHAFNTQFDTPKAAAEYNNAKLKAFWNIEENQWPSLDFILLGMGDDGHTASLFPGTEALQICDQWVTVGNKDDNFRLTFTIPLLNQAQTVVLLIAGENKNSILKEILMVHNEAAKYPVEFVHPQGELLWMLDAAAGNGLN
jgi:6-phosphogluconolactonase